MRFRPEQHLRRQGDFRAVRELGRRVDCGAFTLWWHRRGPAVATAQKFRPRRRPHPAWESSPRSPPSAPRFSATCAKRRLRAVFRQHQQLVPAGCDLLLVARAAVNRLPYPEVEQKFIEACRRITPPKDV